MIQRREFLAATAALLSPLPLSPFQSRAGDDMIAAERAFARMAQERGITPAFIAFAADDAVIFRPGPTLAHPVLVTDTDTPGLTLDWWPVLNGVSRSDDFGYSVGPWLMTDTTSGRSRAGYYVTVWRREGDGSWKFVIDGAGATLDTLAVRPKTSDVMRIANSTALARTDVDATSADDALNTDLTVALTSAYRDRLHPQAWVLGSGVEPSPTEASARAELARRPTTLTCRRLGGGAASSADVAYTYGSARFEGDAGHEAVDANYLRVWRRDEAGWRLVIDSLSRIRA